MKNHDEYRDLIPLYAIGSLQGEERDAVVEHLGSDCVECRDLLVGYERIADGLSRMVPSREPSAEVGRSVKARARRTRAGTESDHGYWDDLVALDALGSLSTEERVALTAHIDAGCRVCATHRKCGERIGEMLAQAPPELEPSASISRRIKARIRALARGGDVDVRGRAVPGSEAGSAGPLPATVPDAQPVRSILVGRAPEKALIEARLDELCGGEGAFVSIEGEAGVGKSRLVAEMFGPEKGPEVEVWMGRAVPLEGTSAYAPFIDMIESWAALADDVSESERARALEAAVAEVAPEDVGAVFPPIARLMRVNAGPHARAVLADMEGKALERRIHEGLCMLLSRICEQGPLVVVLEDLHWADDATLALLESLLPLVETCPLMVVALMRSDGGPGVQRVLRFADHAIRLHHHRIRLVPLAECESLVLARGVLGNAMLPNELARAVREKGEGNPFYIEEIVHAALQSGAVSRENAAFPRDTEGRGFDVPGGIDAMIMSRVERLPNSARRVLETGAVIGRRFHRHVLERVLGDVADLDGDLKLLESMQFLEPSKRHDTASVRVRLLRPETAYVFRHALVRDAVLQTLSVSVCKDLHGRCASAIEQVFSHRLHDYYGVLAYQYIRAGRLEQAQEYLLLAGESAASSAASADALTFFREAYQTYRQVWRNGGDKVIEARLERNLALALLNTGGLAESIDHFNAALRLLGEWVPRSRAAIRAKAGLDFLSIVVRLYRGSLGRARPPASDRERTLFDLMYNRCRAQNIVDDQRRAADNLAAIRHVGDLDPSSVDNATGILAAAGAFFAFSGISFGPSHRFLDIAARVAKRGGVKDAFLYRTMAFVVHYLEGDWSESHEIDEESFQQGIRYGLLWDADVYLGMACERSIHQGYYEKAAQQIERLGDLRREWGYEFSRSNELAATTYLLLAERRLDGAHAAAQRWHDLREEPSLRLLALGVRARVEVLEGRLDDAEHTLVAADRVVRGGGSTFPYYAGICRTARLALDVERIECAMRQEGNLPHSLVRRARRSCRQALSSARKVARDRGETMRLAGRLAWLTGRRHDALGWWRRAREECERLGMRAELGRVWADTGRALADADAKTVREARVTAAICLQRAHSLFEALGGEWDMEQLTVLERRRSRAA